MVAFAQLQSRNKHNTVSRYEVDDASDDEIADTRFYYQVAHPHMIPRFNAALFHILTVRK